MVVLGSTGSIGRQAIEVARRHPDLLSVVGLVAGSDREGLAEQAQSLRVDATGLGPEAAVRLAALDDADVVLNAVVGAAGLRASVAALEAGKVLALANKESLVAGGEVCIAAASRGGGAIVPVDSEHSAIAQCLEGRPGATVERILLTASGGPFRERPDLSKVTPSEALAHPTWRMGPKITVDSATLMNKGLEVIEAHFLFGLPYERIEVVVHPQSIVHGIVELVDSSVLLQAAPTDMRIPIQAALLWPQRAPSPAEPLDFKELRALTFAPVDDRRFPLVGLAYEAGRMARSYPAALNAANEEAVRAFLDDAIAFTEIGEVVERVMEAHDPVDVSELDAVLEVDRRARMQARRVMTDELGSASRAVAAGRSES